MENKLPEIDRNVAHPQAVWFNEHWRPVIEQLESDLQITRHKIETLLTINMRQDAEVTGLKSQIKHWEDKEVEKASCCFENEQENISLKSKLKIAKDALEEIAYSGSSREFCTRVCEQTLSEIGGEI